MGDLHKRGREIVFQELERLGLNPTADSIEQVSGPIEIINPKRIKFIVRTSAGANEPRRWDAGQFDKDNFSKSCFYIFINRWKNQSIPHELFVVPSLVLRKVVKWEASRPKFNMTEGQDLRFKNNWKPVLSLLKSN